MVIEVDIFKKRNIKNIFKKKNFIEKLYYKNKEFFDYSIVSTVCTGILYFLYFFITWITNGKYIVANFIAYFVSFAVLFVWDQRIFKSRPIRRKARIYQLFVFIVLRIIGFMIDSSILVLLIEKFNVPNVYSKVLSSLITFMFNYVTNKLFVFKKNKLL